MNVSEKNVSEASLSETSSSGSSSVSLTARDVMSSPVRTIVPEMTIEAAQCSLLRYGHSSLCVVDAQGQLVGMISRRDLDLALHHGLGQQQVRGLMSQTLKTVTPETPLSDVEQLMVTHDIGRLPVLTQGDLNQRTLRGIVTRTDVLRGRTRYKTSAPISGPISSSNTGPISGSNTAPNSNTDPNVAPSPGSNADPTLSALSVKKQLSQRLLPQFWQLLEQAASLAEQQGWHLYLVGGGVRDLLLADPNAPFLLSDIDLMVDGFYAAVTDAAGVELAQALQHYYPQARLEVHGKFQTAALLWQDDPVFGSLGLDIATARTEFYPYPAANPEVDASSISQDLYRRDFTVNALALKLTEPRAGELLDFFGGVQDLRDRQIRVLHANSFIEDPTRIFRAVRFAVRLRFDIEPQTRRYIAHAIRCGIYERTQAENAIVPALQTRLRSELKYLLQAPYWEVALRQLGELEALRCLHSDLRWTRETQRRLRTVDRCLRRLVAQVVGANSNKSAGKIVGDQADSPVKQLGLNLEPWRLRLELLLLSLAPDQRSAIAIRLQLPQDTIQRLEKLSLAEPDLPLALEQAERPSQIYEILQPYELELLVLLATQLGRSQRRKLWLYLIHWRTIQPLLNGNDLKALGYKPGRQFKTMLKTLLMAQLDGAVKTKLDAQQRLQARFPRN